MNDIDFNELKKRLSYDPNTGNFIWLQRVSRSTYPGTIAGTPNSNGHIQIRISGKRFFAHRLAWGFVYGEWPKGVIDHINGIRNDNRIINLRDVTISENAQNQRTPRMGSKSGYLGVSFVQSRGKWQAGITANGKFKFLGHFDSPEIAHAAYIDAKRVYHPTAPVN